MGRLVVIVVVIVSMTGCSLANPFVTRDLTVPGAPPPPKEPRASTPGKIPTLEEAYVYSADVKHAYRGAVRDQAKLEALLALGLIPLTAAAMGLGATGTAPDAVLALGFAGAAALGIGTWFSNRPRQLAWIAGLKAVTCAEDAMAPLNVPAALSEDLSRHATALGNALRDLEEASARLETEADHAKALRVGTDTSVRPMERAVSALRSLEEAARAELKDTQTVIAGAETTLRNGRELEQTLRTAGRKLVVAVSKITDEVDRLIVESARDPAALANVISGLGGTYRTITTVPEGIARTGAKDAAAARAPIPQAAPDGPGDRAKLEEIATRRDALAAALNDVRVQVARVAAARRPVADIVNSVVKDTPFDKLKSCGVEAGDLITAIAVDPAPPFVITKPGSVVFTIKGGLPPYGAGLASGPGGLSVAPAGPFSPVITASATKDTPDGDFAIEVRDSKNQSKLVTVKVESKPGEAPAGERTTSPPADALTQLAAKLNRDKPEVEAQGVKVPITGAKLSAKGDRVIVAIGEPRPGPDAKTERLTEAVRNKVIEEHAQGLGVKPEQVGFENADALVALGDRPAPQSACEPVRLSGRVSPDPVFNGLSEIDRRRVQAAVCLVGKQVDGLWGPITKGKVMEYQCRRKLPQDGVLTKDLAEELLTLRAGAIQRHCGSR
jgi:hypothetical protein